MSERDKFDQSELSPEARRIAKAVAWQIAELAERLYRSKTLREIRSVMRAMQELEREL